MAKVLVTGGAGYIGSVLVSHLLKRDWQVTVLDKLVHGQSSLFQHAGNRNFNFVRGDVCDESLMKDLINKHDAIIPLAAIVGAPACDLDPLAAKSVNFEAIELISKLRSHDHIVVYPCSESSYGTKSGDAFCTEEMPLEPITLYGDIKMQAERILLSNKNSISLRLATVFGPSPRMRIDLLVNDFVLRAITDGFLVIFEKDFKRNYIHIDDVGECFCHCLENFQSMKGNAYNLGLNEANLTKEELALKIKEYVPHLYIHFAEIGTDPDKRNYIICNEKLIGKGFTAKRSLNEGIEQLLNLYKMFPRSAYRNY